MFDLTERQDRLVEAESVIQAAHSFFATFGAERLDRPFEWREGRSPAVPLLGRTNPIESTFATVRHRTIRSKGCLSNKTALAMVFKLVEAAQKSWRRLRGYNQLPKVVQGVKFNDGIEVVRLQTQAAA